MDLCLRGKCAVVTGGSKASVVQSRSVSRRRSKRCNLREGADALHDAERELLKQGGRVGLECVMLAIRWPLMAF